MTRPTNEQTPGYSSRRSSWSVHTHSLIESLSHLRQARKNQVQRWQLSLRAGTYRRYLGIGVQGTISDPLRRTVVSSRVRSWKQQTMLITQRLRYPINQEETRLPCLLWPAGISNPWESGLWSITYLHLFVSSHTIALDTENLFLSRTNSGLHRTTPLNQASRL